MALTMILGTPSLAVELAQNLLGLVALDGGRVLLHDDVRALFGRDAGLDFLADEVGVLNGLETAGFGLVWGVGMGFEIYDGLANIDVLLRSGRHAGFLPLYPSLDPIDHSFPSKRAEAMMEGRYTPRVMAST